MRALVLFLAMLTSISVHADEPMRKYGVSLLQPEAVLQARVSSVEALATYIGAIERASNKFLSTLPQGQPTTGFIVLAVRPGMQVRSWLDLSPPLPPEMATQLKDAMGQVMPFRAKEGPVVFAVSVGVWGGSASAAPAPSLSEFSAAAKAAGRPLEVGEIVERIWND